MMSPRDKTEEDDDQLVEVVAGSNQEDDDQSLINLDQGLPPKAEVEGSLDKSDKELNERGSALIDSESGSAHQVK